MEKVRIAHLTTVHPRVDARIRIKEVESLANAFAEPVALFVQDGKGNSIEAGGKIRIIDTGAPPSGRFSRIILGTWRMGLAVYKMRPRIAHFHDPELIPLGFVLKGCGFKVVYDAHEDVPRDVLTKFWLPAIMRRPISWFMSLIEWLAGLFLTAIVPAEPDIAARFPVRKTVLIQNFPILDELVLPETQVYKQRPPHFAYIGAIGRTRGIHEMVEAMERSGINDIRLQLAGIFQPASLKSEIEALTGWQQVEYSGWANRDTVSRLLNNVRAGLVVLHPTPKILNAYPTKMFEYMSVGLPVITSDFPVWRHIIDSAGCGLLVDPLDPTSIADAMHWILDNPREAESMGQRGQRAVEEIYNWEHEGDKLINLYKKLLPNQMEL